MHAPAAPSWCKQCTVTLGLTTGFESLLKDQTECLTKPADGKSFLCLGDAQSVGFLRVLRGEQRGNWHGGELLHEDDWSISNNSDACMLMARLQCFVLCYASRTNRPPGHCGSSISPSNGIIATRSTNSFFMKMTGSRFGDFPTSTSALFAALLPSGLLCVASLMEGHDSTLVYIDSALLERDCAGFDLVHDNVLLLHFCDAILQQQMHTACAFFMAIAANASAGCVMVLPGLSTAQLIAMLSHSGFQSEFRLDEISGTNFAGDHSLQILSSPILLQSIPLFRPRILEYTEPYFGNKLICSCLVLSSSLTILVQNDQLWLIIAQDADNNITALFPPLDTSYVCLLTEYHFHNTILFLARASCFQSLHLQSSERLPVGFTLCDSVRVWTVHIARLATYDCLQVCNMDALCLHEPSGYSVARPLRPFAVCSVAFHHRYSPPPSAATRFAGRGGEGVKGAEVARTIRETTVTSCMPHSTAVSVGIQAVAVRINESGSSWSDWSDMTDLKFNKSIRLRLRGGSPNQTVKFLIDGASNATIVNDIALLDPNSVTQVTEIHKTAGHGATIRTTAAGLISRMWQLRNQSWVGFTLKASYSESIDVNVMSETALYTELGLVTDKFERQALRPPNVSEHDPSLEVLLTMLGELFYVHTIAMPTTDDQNSSSSRTNYAISSHSLASALGASKPLALTPAKDGLVNQHDIISPDDRLVDDDDEPDDEPEPAVTSSSRKSSLRPRSLTVSTTSMPTKPSSLVIHKRPNGRAPNSRYGPGVQIWDSDNGCWYDPNQWSSYGEAGKSVHADDKRKLPKHVYHNRPGAQLPYYAQVWNGTKNVTLGSYATQQQASLAATRFKLNNDLDESAKRANRETPKYIKKITNGSAVKYQVEYRDGKKRVWVGYFRDVRAASRALKESRSARNLPVSDSDSDDSSDSGEPEPNTDFEKAVSLIELARGHCSLLDGWQCIFTGALTGKFIGPHPTDAEKRMRTSDFNNVLKCFQLRLPVRWHLKLKLPPSETSTSSSNVPVQPCSSTAGGESLLQRERECSLQRECSLSEPIAVEGPVEDPISLSAQLADSSTADAVALAESLLDSSNLATAELPRMLTAEGENVENVDLSVNSCEAALEPSHTGLDELLDDDVSAFIEQSKQAEKPAATIGNGVEVKESMLADAGRGLFAQRDFSKGSIVTEYAGTKLRDKFDAARCFPQTHINHCSAAFHGQLSNDIYIDGICDPIPGSGGGSFANHQAKQDCNADFAVIDGNVFLKATKHITTGDEIYVHCGTDLDVMMGRKRRVVVENVDRTLAIDAISL